MNEITILLSHGTRTSDCTSSIVMESSLKIASHTTFPRDSSLIRLTESTCMVPPNCNIPGGANWAESEFLGAEIREIKSFFVYSV